MTGVLAGKVAFVAGASRGIGATVAEALAREGAAVAVAARSEQEGKVPGTIHAVVDRITSAGGRALPVQCDVTSEESVEAAVAQTVSEFCGIDILVANAGVSGRNDVLWQYPIDEWKQVIDVNLNGLFYCNRAVVPFMRDMDYGRIVNIASVAGKEGNPNASAYSTSKAGVIGLTKSLGKELAKTGIRVNCVTPAAVKTAIFDQMSQQHIDFMLSKIPMGRFGTVDEIAALVCWLASEDCSFSTGAVFDASGGRATY